MIQSGDDEDPDGEKRLTEGRSGTRTSGPETANGSLGVRREPAYPISAHWAGRGLRPLDPRPEIRRSPARVPAVSSRARAAQPLIALALWVTRRPPGWPGQAVPDGGHPAPEPDRHRDYPTHALVHPNLPRLGVLKWFRAVLTAGRAPFGPPGRRSRILLPQACAVAASDCLGKSPPEPTPLHSSLDYPPHGPRRPEQPHI